MANAIPLHYGRHKFVTNEPLPVLTNANQPGIIGGGNATVVFTCPANDSISVDYIDMGYRVAATGSIQVSDGTLTWGPFSVVLAGLQTIQFDPPLGPFTKGANVTVTMIDGSQTKDLFAQAHVEGTEVY